MWSDRSDNANGATIDEHDELSLGVVGPDGNREAEPVDHRESTTACPTSAQPSSSSATEPDCKTSECTMACPAVEHPDSPSPVESGGKMPVLTPKGFSKILIEAYHPRVALRKVFVVLPLRVMKLVAVVLNEKVGGVCCGWSGFENRLLGNDNRRVGQNLRATG